MTSRRTSANEHDESKQRAGRARWAGAPAEERARQMRDLVERRRAKRAERLQETTEPVAATVSAPAVSVEPGAATMTRTEAASVPFATVVEPHPLMLDGALQVGPESPTAPTTGEARNLRDTPRERRQRADHARIVESITRAHPPVGPESHCALADHGWPEAVAFIVAAKACPVCGKAADPKLDADRVGRGPASDSERFEYGHGGIPLWVGWRPTRGRGPFDGGGR